MAFFRLLLAARSRTGTEHERGGSPGPIAAATPLDPYSSQAFLVQVELQVGAAFTTSSSISFGTSSAVVIGRIVSTSSVPSPVGQQGPLDGFFQRPDVDQINPPRRRIFSAARKGPVRRLAARSARV
jgi:hypothetical protein